MIFIGLIKYKGLLRSLIFFFVYRSKGCRFLYITLGEGVRWKTFLCIKHNLYLNTKNTR